MGWKGTLRSIGAAARRAEREHERAVRAEQRESLRRLRELEREQAEFAKLAERERAEKEVALAQAQLDVLLSVHKQCCAAIDWSGVSTSGPPEKPTLEAPRRENHHEETARRSLENYQPSFFDWFLSRSDDKRRKLSAEILRGKQHDDHAHQIALEEHNRQRQVQYREWQEQMKEWEELKKLAVRVLAGDVKAYADAITQMNPYAELKQLGSTMKFKCSSQTMEIGIEIHGDEAIPSESKSLTKTGRVSVKKLSDGKRMEIYQDHICGCVLRVARETLALLPLSTCVVTASVKLLDSKTGHKVNQPILSVAYHRKTAKDVNWETVDPTDAMKNFLHRMKFKKSAGFEPIEPVKAADLAHG